MYPRRRYPQQDSYLIGMSQANEGEPWRQAMNDQIAAAAAAHPEFEVVFADAAQNNAKQVADVENFLQQGIDLLIISPNEAAPLTDVVAEVCAEGVPVIVLDRKVNGDQFTMWIGADNEEIGQRAGSTPQASARSRTSIRATSSRFADSRDRRRPRSAATASGRVSRQPQRHDHRPAECGLAAGKSDPGLAGDVPGKPGRQRGLHPQ